jgi:YesN/AraC family two-component response regulator
MVTKSEEEHIMEEAIGSQIADYILKPVNPNQILLSLKKNLQQDNLVEQKRFCNISRNSEIFLWSFLI